MPEYHFRAPWVNPEAFADLQPVVFAEWESSGAAAYRVANPDLRMSYMMERFFTSHIMGHVTNHLSYGLPSEISDEKYLTEFALFLSRPWLTVRLRSGVTWTDNRSAIHEWLNEIAQTTHRPRLDFDQRTMDEFLEYARPGRWFKRRTADRVPHAVRVSIADHGPQLANLIVRNYWSGDYEWEYSKAPIAHIRNYHEKVIE